MFKLVGKEIFEINKVRCAITIEAVAMFAYEYTLTVGGKAYEKFREQQKKALQVWQVHFGDEDARICLGNYAKIYDKNLEKDTMDIWVNGNKVNTTVFKYYCKS